MVNEWRNDCSFVIMDSVTVTVKVIDALICQKHVVSRRFFEDLIHAIESKQKTLPVPEK
jgi:hypothetical protein